MDRDEFERRLREVAKISERPIDSDGARTRHGAYKDYGGFTVDSIKPCSGPCPECLKPDMCGRKRTHRRTPQGWQSYCCGCGLYRNRVTGRYEIKNAQGIKTFSQPNATGQSTNDANE